METSAIVKWCAVNCANQHSGEMSVYNMYKAYEYTKFFRELAGTKGPILGIDFIKELGRLVEPRLNEYGFRCVPVTIQYKVIPWEPIAQGISNLLMAYAQNRLLEPSPYGGTPTSGYPFLKEFQLIHPFVDGNGRVGALLYNYINETLDNLAFAPEIF